MPLFSITMRRVYFFGKTELILAEYGLNIKAPTKVSSEQNYNLSSNLVNKYGGTKNEVIFYNVCGPAALLYPR